MGNIVQCRMLGFFRSLRAFDLLPAGQDFRAIARRCLAEDMRVATLQLVADGGADIVKVKASLFLRHLRIEHHLEQQIAQFTAQIVKIFPLDSIEDLVGLLKGVRGDSGKGLLFIPWAAVFRVAQAAHDAEQAVNLSHVTILEI